MNARCVDELESQLSKHGSLKRLYFYHQHLTTVCFRFYFSLFMLVLRICKQKYIFDKYGKTGFQEYHVWT